MDQNHHMIDGLRPHGDMSVPCGTYLLLRYMHSRALSDYRVLLRMSSGHRWSCISKTTSESTPEHGYQYRCLSRAQAYLQSCKRTFLQYMSDGNGSSYLDPDCYSTLEAAPDDVHFPADPAPQHRPPANNHKTLPSLAILFNLSS